MENTVDLSLHGENASEHVPSSLIVRTTPAWHHMKRLCEPWENQYLAKCALVSHTSFDAAHALSAQWIAATPHAISRVANFLCRVFSSRSVAELALRISTLAPALVSSKLRGNSEAAEPPDRLHGPLTGIPVQFLPSDHQRILYWP
jgi:hypothetical protein